MASNTYTQYCVDGSLRLMRRAEKQGRKTLPVELVKVSLTAYVLPETKRQIEQKAHSLNMSLSAYVELSVSLFDIRQFSTAENC